MNRIKIPEWENLLTKVKYIFIYFQFNTPIGHPPPPNRWDDYSRLIIFIEKGRGEIVVGKGFKKLKEKFCHWFLGRKKPRNWILSKWIIDELPLLNTYIVFGANILLWIILFQRSFEISQIHDHIKNCQETVPAGWSLKIQKHTLYSTFLFLFGILQISSSIQFALTGKIHSCQDL